MTGDAGAIPTVYLDQCVLSRLQRDDPQRHEFECILQTIKSNGYRPVFSDVHIAEIEQSERPGEFARILDDIHAQYLPQVRQPQSAVRFDAGRPHDRIAPTADPF